MSKQIELEKLDRAIKDGTIRLSTIKANMDLLDREIEKLLEVEQALEENLHCLKSPTITPIASEYKKAKDDLKKTKVRLFTARIERSDFQKAYDGMTWQIQKWSTDMENIKKIGENNVVHANFGSKKDG
jgi:predicted  nucleic acid-binding Zn-ribbon protein